MSNRTPLIIAIVLLLLPVLYVGSYSALVVPAGAKYVTIPPNPNSQIIEPPSVTVVNIGVLHYRCGGLWMERLYWPLEQIDRKVRPGVWEAMPWETGNSSGRSVQRIVLP